MKHIYKVVCVLVIAFFSFVPNLRAISGINLSSGSLVPYFSEKTTKYNVFVPSDVENINISVNETEEDDYVTGTGNISLTDGKNVIILKVVKKNLEIVDYEISVFKNYKENKDYDNAYLNKLEIEGYEINFDSNTFEYEIYIENEDRLNINYEQANENSVVKISGNSNFKIGQNVVKITVISKNKTNTNVYVIKVNKVANVFEEFSSSEKEDFNLFGKDKLNKKETILVIISLSSVVFLIIYTIFYLLFIRKRNKH